MIAYQYALRRRCLMMQEDVTVDFVVTNYSYTTQPLSGYAKIKVQGTGEWITQSQTLVLPKGTVLQLYIEISSSLDSSDRTSKSTIRIDGDTVLNMRNTTELSKEYLYTLEKNCTINAYNHRNMENGVSKTYGSMRVTTVDDEVTA